jgi:hypothetical protein
MSLKSHGARCPRGSIDTIFFLSAHWGNGPMVAAGSVFVKSGLILLGDFISLKHKICCRT